MRTVRGGADLGGVVQRKERGAGARKLGDGDGGGEEDDDDDEGGGEEGDEEELVLTRSIHF